MGKKLVDTMTWEQLHDHVLTKVGRKIKVRERETFKKWFMYREKIGYLIDSAMILRCFRIWQEIEHNLDHFIVISGREGLGKTTLSFQIAAWVNPDGFSLNNVCYGAKQYLDVLSRKAKQARNNGVKLQSESIVMDEGTELLSRESLNITNRSLTKTFFVQRALKFLVIVNIPSFHMLDSVIRNHRVRTLIEITSRGKYKAISGLGIRIIAKEGQYNKQVDGIKIPYGTFWEGYFNKEFPGVIDQEQYLEHKMISIDDTVDLMKDDIIQLKMISAQRISKELGCKVDTIITRIKTQEYEGKQIGSKWYLTRRAYDKIMTVPSKYG